jgi:CheY-like chemotaxis protein
MAKAKILIVEDENIVVLDLQMRLNSLGYAVAAVAATGQEAIKKAGETRPDLALMDINLKGARLNSSGRVMTCRSSTSRLSRMNRPWSGPRSPNPMAICSNPSKSASCTRPSKWLFTNTRWSVS